MLFPPVFCGATVCECCSAALLGKMVRAPCLQSLQCHRCLYQTCGCYNRMANSFMHSFTPVLSLEMVIDGWSFDEGMRARAFLSESRETFGSFQRSSWGKIFIIFFSVVSGKRLEELFIQSSTRCLHCQKKKTVDEGSEGRTKEFHLSRLFSAVVLIVLRDS